MPDIFISYTSEDRERAKALAVAIESQGFSVWLDPKIPPGEIFHRVIMKTLSETKCVVVLWSKHSVRSNWVIEEATIGKNRNILVPAKLDAIDPPLGFKLIQAADLIDWNLEPSHPGYVSLLNTISDIVGLPSNRDKSKRLKPRELPSKIDKIEQLIYMALASERDQETIEFLEYRSAEIIINFLENRRVLYSPFFKGCPHGVIRSIRVMRERLQDEIENIIFSRKSSINEIVREMRSASTAFLNYACASCDNPASCDQCEIYEIGCMEGMIFFRLRMASSILKLSRKYKIPISKPLKSILSKNSKIGLMILEWLSDTCSADKNNKREFRPILFHEAETIPSDRIEFINFNSIIPHDTYLRKYFIESKLYVSLSTKKIGRRLGGLTILNYLREKYPQVFYDFDFRKFLFEILNAHLSDHESI